MTCALAAVTSLALWLGATNASNGAPPTFDPAVLQDGDVILRHTHGRWSNYFRDASPVDRRFSHIGIIVRDPTGPQVIHADASDVTGVGRVRNETLAAFLHEAEDWAVFRAHAPAEQRACIATEARRFLGVPFDARFDLDDASRVYCTELIFRAFQRAVGPAVIPLSERNGHSLVFLDSCYLGPEFILVAERRR